MQGRGLKPIIGIFRNRYKRSPLMQGRGLKQKVLDALGGFYGRPLCRGVD